MGNIVYFQCSRLFKLLKKFSKKVAAIFRRCRLIKLIYLVFVGYPCLYAILAILISLPRSVCLIIRWWAKHPFNNNSSNNGWLGWKRCHFKSGRPTPSSSWGRSGKTRAGEPGWETSCRKTRGKQLCRTMFFFFFNIGTRPLFLKWKNQNIYQLHKLPPLQWLKSPTSKNRHMKTVQL